MANTNVGPWKANTFEFKSLSQGFYITDWDTGAMVLTA